MEKILITCQTEAEFVGPSLEIFRIKGSAVGVPTEAPAWVKDVYMFRFLKKQGKVTWKPYHPEINPVVAESVPDVPIDTSIDQTVEEPEGPKESKTEGVKKTSKRTAKAKGDAE